MLFNKRAVNKWTIMNLLTFITSIKKMNKTGIQVRAIDRRVYLINKALYEREVELLKNGKAKKEKSSDTFTQEKEKAAAGISTE